MRLSILLVLAITSIVLGQIENLTLDPPVMMPEGNQFLTWENKTVYSRTYYIDQNAVNASDDNPGTESKPFKTINKAAQVLEPGQQVIIKSGVYRELIVPRQGGSGPDRMISYTAAPGAEVVIKGSMIIDNKWTRSLNPTQYSEKLWMINLPADMFPGVSPFKIQNASAQDIEIMPWAAEWVGRYPYTLPRGMVFQDGRRLAQLATYEDLPRVPGSFWVAATGDTIHIHAFGSGYPNESKFEITIQQQLFRPDVTDLGYIQVTGLTFMQAGNGLPRTGTGALFTNGGHHWIIEDNIFEQINSVAVEIGAVSLETSGDKEIMQREWQRAQSSPGGMIVRNNTISECGTGGIQGFVTRNTLVENNHLYNIGWQDVERYWECGAIKLLVVTNTLVRNNLIHDIEAGSAIWLDYNIHNSRITQNTVFDISMCCNGALFIEASLVPNMIDNNIVWDTHGIAIYTGDSDSLIIAHNLIGPCSNAGVYSIVGTDRVFNGRPFTSHHNLVYGNIFYTEVPVYFDDPDNFSEGNVFTGEFDLTSWQSNGYDKNGTLIPADWRLDKQAFVLSVNASKKLPLIDRHPAVSVDFNGNQRSGKTTAGPLEERKMFKLEIGLDPRRCWNGDVKPDKTIQGSNGGEKTE